MSELEPMSNKEISSQHGLWIDNQARSGHGDIWTTHDPAHGDPLWQASTANEHDVAEAVASAHAAFAHWSLTPLAERVRIVEAYGEILKQRADELAMCISREVGKTLWETRGEIQTMIGKIALSLAALRERAGDADRPAPFGGLQLRHRPHGVMAVLGPYNFPGHLPNGHIVPALLAGNSVVFKPSEFAPQTGLAMAKAFHDAGLPAGVLNVVIGGRVTGAALLGDDHIQGVLFTGSAHTGTMIHRQFGGRPDIVLALEMGGNNPLVVWPPADANAVADLVMHSAFITSGQRCSCARRLIVPEGAIGEHFVEAILARAQTLKIGTWSDEPEPFMGPLVHDKAGAMVLDFQAQLVGSGARVLLEARSVGPRPSFVSPGIVDVTGLEPPDEECFGPILQIYRVKDFASALARANHTRFGLSAGLISDDAALWESAQQRLRAGILNWNRPTTGASGAMPFGGPGLSGNHKPSAYYAADYCAYPVASQIAPSAQPLPAIGMG